MFKRIIDCIARFLYPAKSAGCGDPTARRIIMIRRLLLCAVIIAVIAGCGRYRYITPKPDFTWPEMASSQIGGSLGVYIPADNLELVLKADESKKCCDHKDIKFGAGAFKMMRQASEAVFSNTIALGKKPTDTYIKSLGVRGVLHLKDYSANVEFIPYIASDQGKADIKSYNVTVSLTFNFSAIDLELSDMREFNVAVESSTAEPVGRKQVNGALGRLVDEALEKAADHLARELVNTYGARS